MRCYVYQDAEPVLHRLNGQAIKVPIKREIVIYNLIRGSHNTTFPYHPSKYPASRYSKTEYARLGGRS